MKVIVSPAKNMAADGVWTAPVGPEQPMFDTEARTVMDALSDIPLYRLPQVLHCGEKLALEAMKLTQEFGNGARQEPLLSFRSGMVFRRMDAASFSQEDWAAARQRLIVLSGVYGALRPGDGIYPYRLDVGCTLPVEGYQNLYKFWGDRIYHFVFASGEPVIDLASAEYGRLIRPFLRAGDRLITCRFYQIIGGRIQSRVIYIKEARGLMARYIVQNRISDPMELLEFREGGYEFEPGLSSGDVLVFVQK